jgi:hypothetical protein
MKRTRTWPIYVGFILGGLVSGFSFAQSSADGLSACTSVADEKSRLKCYDEQMARAGKKVPAPAKSAPPSTTSAPPSTTSAPPSATSAPPSTAPASPSAASAPPSAPPSATPSPHATPPTKQAPPARVAASESRSSEFGLDGEALRKKRVEEDREDPRAPDEMTARVAKVSERAHGEYRIELDNGQIWVETLRTGGMAPGAGETITIKRGMMGSFYLTRESGLALRVKRIK